MQSPGRADFLRQAWSIFSALNFYMRSSHIRGLLTTRHDAYQPEVTRQGELSCNIQQRLISTIESRSPCRFNAYKYGLHKQCTSPLYFPAVIVALALPSSIDMDPSLIPKLPPPSSKTVNFVYPHRKDRIRTLQHVLIAMTIIIVTTRKLYFRDYTRQRLLWDDCKHMVCW